MGSKGTPPPARGKVPGQGAAVGLHRVAEDVPVVARQEHDTLSTGGRRHQARQRLDHVAAVVTQRLAAALEVLVDGVDHHADRGGFGVDGGLDRLVQSLSVHQLAAHDEVGERGLVVGLQQGRVRSPALGVFVGVLVARLPIEASGEEVSAADLGEAGNGGQDSRKGRPAHVALGPPGHRRPLLGLKALEDLHRGGPAHPIHQDDQDPKALHLAGQLSDELPCGPFDGRDPRRGPACLQPVHQPRREGLVVAPSSGVCRLEDGVDSCVQFGLEGEWRTQAASAPVDEAPLPGVGLGQLERVLMLRAGARRGALRPHHQPRGQADGHVPRLSLLVGAEHGVEVVLLQPRHGPADLLEGLGCRVCRQRCERSSQVALSGGVAGWQPGTRGAGGSEQRLRDESIGLLEHGQVDPESLKHLLEQAVDGHAV